MVIAFTKYTNIFRCIVECCSQYTNPATRKTVIQLGAKLLQGSFNRWGTFRNVCLPLICRNLKYASHFLLDFAVIWKLNSWLMFILHYCTVLSVLDQSKVIMHFIFIRGSISPQKPKSFSCLQCHLAVDSITASISLSWVNAIWWN